ncbi:MFS transporter [Ketogulonicigenium vulgare]|uniref:Arabinose efflux permease family protein n=1 Tax=Ketogulonicigenium vulgare (strain WSH-001) TaxID=759362 RepID=F9Y3M7_KETVW|nr:MFS transporter [Ketogulonicigenium vulgare]ADO42187.1 major facilitator family protein [Ketogulonicigenium vulgare Y25]AEM40391.1 Arabinose efflux permease family protein [Ketogulonicigenium vulgare WSH-001]ALJ80578.1 arabinose ABC transporter permease [Ketogulonicigenium vulgare]AOZ54104.1 major facilitator family protein [Ketogulonicigenium vulgare]
MALRQDFRTLMRNPSFVLFTLSSLASSLAYWMLRTTSGWHAWQLTHDTAWVGIVVAADMIPAMLVGPWAGQLADRLDLRRILMASTMASVVLMVSTAAMVGMGLASVWLLCAIMMTNGIIAGLSQPAHHAAVGAVTDRPQMGTAVSISSILFNVSRFIGPAISGIIIAGASIQASYGSVALVMVFSLLGLFLVRFRPTVRMTGQKGIINGLAEAFHYIMASPACAPMFIIFASAALFLRPIGELLPELADLRLGGDARTLAQLSSAMGLGAIVAGLTNMVGGIRGVVRLSFVGTGIATLAGLGLGWSASTPVALIAAGFYGGAIAAGGVSIQTALQVTAPEAMRGRIMGLFGMTFRVAPALGAIGMGALASRLGLSQTFTLGCALMMAVLVVLSRQFATAKRGIIAE